MSKTFETFKFGIITDNSYPLTKRRRFLTLRGKREGK